MSKKSKHKKITVATIDSKALMMNSKGKLGKHDPIVRLGTGKHKSKKTYNRKSKQNQLERQSYKDYSPFQADFF